MICTRVQRFCQVSRYRPGRRRLASPEDCGGAGHLGSRLSNHRLQFSTAILTGASADRTDGSLVAELLATDASREELVEAYAWITNNEAPMNAGRPLASGRVAQLIDILEAAVEDEPTVSPL